MLVQDTLTGYLHEVPDSQLYESTQVYDGLGQPLGLPFLAPILGAALPAIASLLPGIARGAAGLIPQVAQTVARALPGGLFTPGAPPAGASGMPMPFQPPLPTPWPSGWIRPPLPYTGLGPRRLYMRCATWPGPTGLVPAHAATMPPAPLVPPPGPAGTPMLPQHRRRFRRIR